MYIVGDSFSLEALDNVHAGQFAKGIESPISSKFTFTGSIPMRQIDVAKTWDKEREAGSVLWAIKQNGDDFIGICGLHSHRDIYRSWEFRIFIFSVAAYGQGIGEQALRLVTQYAFERLNAHRVWGGTHEDNKGMRRCFEKCGYKEEGRLREELYCFGKYSDAIRYGVLENEWRNIEPSSSAQAG